MRRFEYLVAPDPAAAARLCKEGATQAKAGGIDLLDRLKEGLDRPARVVGLHEALETSIQVEDGNIRIGSGISLAQLGRHPLVRQELPALAHAAESAATPQVREMATLAGNLLQRSRCWYLRSRHYDCRQTGGDRCWAREGRHENHALFGNQGSCIQVHPSNAAPALFTLDAALELVAADGSQRSLPISRFYVSPVDVIGRDHELQAGEILTAIVIPSGRRGTRAAHYEVRHKQSFDWPLAMAAVNFNDEVPRLVIGAVAPTPITIDETQALNDFRNDPTRERADGIANRVAQRATPLSGNAWRVPILKTAIRRALLQAAGVGEEQW